MTLADQQVAAVVLFLERIRQEAGPRPIAVWEQLRTMMNRRGGARFDPVARDGICARCTPYLVVQPRASRIVGSYRYQRTELEGET